MPCFNAHSQYAAQDSGVGRQGSGRTVGRNKRSALRRSRAKGGRRLHAATLAAVFEMKRRHARPLSSVPSSARAPVAAGPIAPPPLPALPPPSLARLHPPPPDPPSPTGGYSAQP